MTTNCAVLSKGCGSSDSCVYVGEFSVRDSDTMRTAANRACGLASAYHGHQWDVEVKLYEPNALVNLPDIINLGGRFVKLLLGIAGRQFLEDTSVPILLEDTTVGDRPFKWHPLLAIATWFSAEFIVYEHPNENNPPKPAMMGRVNGPPGKIVELIQNRVQKTTEKNMEAEGRAIFGIDVYETECTSPYIVKNQHKVRSMMRENSTLLSMVGGAFLAPSGKGCFLVELKTEKYLRFDYVVFRKDLEGTYKLAGSGMAKGLPRQTLKIVQDRARRFIEEDLVERAMRPRISIHEPRNEVWRISRRELEKVAELTPWQVNDWFVQRSIDVELDQVPQVLLITLLLTDAD